MKIPFVSRSASLTNNHFDTTFDEELASNAGFEVDLAAPTSGKGPSRWLPGIFQSKKADSSTNDDPPYTVRVQEVAVVSPSSLSTHVVEATDNETNTNTNNPKQDLMADVTLTEDEEEEEDSHDDDSMDKAKSKTVATGGTAMTTTMSDRVQEWKRQFQVYIHDEDRRRRWKKAFPYVIAIAFILLLALFLGIILGLKDKKNKNGSPTSIQTTQTPEERWGPASINVLMQLEIENNPQDISWTIYQEGSWELISQVEQGGYDDAARFTNVGVDLIWDENYIFQIQDAGFELLEGVDDNEGGRSRTEGRWLLVFRNTELVVGEGEQWGRVNSVSFFTNGQTGEIDITRQE